MQTPEAAWCGAAYSEEKRVRYRLRPAAAPSPRPQKSGAGTRQWRAKLQESRLRPETRETASKWRSKPPPWQRKIVRAEMPCHQPDLIVISRKSPAFAGLFNLRERNHHTRQAFLLTMGWSALQLQA